MMSLKVKRSGGVLIVELPAELSERLHLGDGDVVDATVSGDSVTLSKPVDRLARQLHVARQIIDDHSETFHALAQR